MLRSLYIAGTGMLVQKDKMEVLTNNISNVETTGYKEDMVVSKSFEDVLLEYGADDPSILNIINSTTGYQNYGTHVDVVVTNFEQGTLEETDIATDMAIEGDGFFVVSTSDGDRYTRDGSFQISSDGYLVTADGNYVQGQNGDIYIGTDDFAVDDSGNISVDGTVVDQLKIVSFEDTDGLRKDGNNLYMNYTGQTVYTDTTSTITQGALEGSNVELTDQIVDMIQISQNYAMNQKMVTMIDETLELAVNEVGKV